MLDGVHKHLGTLTLCQNQCSGVEVFLFLAYKLQHQRNKSGVAHLCEAAPGPLDGDLALVVDGGPDVDGLAGHVAAAVQAHAARDRPRGQTRHAQLVLDLAVERLLKQNIQIKQKYLYLFI